MAKRLKLGEIRVRFINVARLKSYVTNSCLSLEALFNPANEIHQFARMGASNIENVVQRKVLVASAILKCENSIDDVIDTTALATPEVQSALVTLELKGVARRLPGNRFVRAT